MGDGEGVCCCGSGTLGGMVRGKEGNEEGAMEGHKEEGGKLRLKGWRKPTCV